MKIATHRLWIIKELTRKKLGYNIKNYIKSDKSNLVIRQWQCIDEGSLVEGSRR